MKTIYRRLCFSVFFILFCIITKTLLVEHQGCTITSNAKTKPFNPRRIIPYAGQYASFTFKDLDHKALLRAAIDFPRLPLMFLAENSDSDWFFGDDPNCAPLPVLVDLHINNDHWQELRAAKRAISTQEIFKLDDIVLDTSNGPVYLLSAFLDGRQISEKEIRGPTIRIFTLLKDINSPLKLHCQVWFKDIHSPILTEVVSIVYTGLDRDNNKMYGNDLQQNMLICEVPYRMSQEDPVLVSVVNEPCDYARNALKLSYNRRKQGVERKNFAVCVKPQIYPYEDRSRRLIEWIELLVAIGVDKIIIFNFKVHENMEKVLRHYERRGIVDLIPFSMPGYYPNHVYMQYLLTEHRYVYHVVMDSPVYHTCFYQLWDHYQWFSLLDTDEIIIPRMHRTWIDMLNGVDNVTQYSELVFTDVHYPENATNSSSSKVIFNADRSLVLFNHWAMQCISCHEYRVPTSYANVNHYRNGVVASDNLTDERQLLWRFKDWLQERMKSVLAELRID